MVPWSYRIDGGRYEYHEEQRKNAMQRGCGTGGWSAVLGPRVADRAGGSTGATPRAGGCSESAAGGSGDQDGVATGAGGRRGDGQKRQLHSRSQAKRFSGV